MILSVLCWRASILCRLITFVTCRANRALLLFDELLLLILLGAKHGNCGRNEMGTSEQFIQLLAFVVTAEVEVLSCGRVVCVWLEFVAVSFSISVFKLVGMLIGIVDLPQLNFGFDCINVLNAPSTGKLVDDSFAIVFAKRSLYFRRSESVKR